MADIFDKLTAPKQDAPKGDIFDSILANKQGGDNNSEKDINQPKANSDRNAQREANQQGGSSNEAKLYAPQQQREGNRQEPIGSIDASKDGSQQNEALLSQGDIFDRIASKGGEGVEKRKQNAQAQNGSQGQEDGQGLRSQVNAGEQGQVTSPLKVETAFGVPSPEAKKEEIKAAPVRTMSEKAKDFAFGTLARYETGINRGMAGVARTLEAVGIPHGLTEHFSNAAEDAETDWRILAGAEPLKQGSAASTAAEIVSGLAKLPAYALAGPVGVAAGVMDAYGNAKENFRNKLLAKGTSEEEANKQSTLRATISTVATIPLYLLAGAASQKIASRVIPNLENELIKKASTGGINFALNSVASASARAVDAGLSGEDPVKAAKELSIGGALQDAFFAIHSTVENFKNKADKGEIEEAIKELPDATLAIIANHPKSQYKDVANAEIQQREQVKKTQDLSQEAQSTDAPITAEVIKQGDVFEKPSKIISFPALSQEEATKQAEALAKAQPTTPSEKVTTKAEEQGAGGIPPVEGKPAIGKAEGEAEGGTPQGISESKKEVKGTRIAAAAFKPEGSTEVFTGANHDEALGEALKANAITQEYHDAHVGSANAEKRNEAEFGYTTDAIDESGNPETIDREQGHDLAQESGQAIYKTPEEHEFPTENGALIHSTEVRGLQAERVPLKPEEKEFVKGLAEEARKNKPDMGRPGAASTEEYMQRYQSSGASYLADGIYDFGKWSVEMLKEYGEGVREYLPEAFERSKMLINDLATASAQAERKTPETKQVKVNERAAYLDSLKAQQKAGEAGFKRGTKEATEAVRAKLQPTIDTLRNTNRLLKTTIANSVSKAKQLSAYFKGMERGSIASAKNARAQEQMAVRWHEADKNTIWKQVHDYLFKEIPQSGVRLSPSDVKTFSNKLNRILTTPYNPRGGRKVGEDFVSTSEMMWQNVKDLTNTIQAKAEEVHLTALREEVKDMVKKSLASKIVSPEFRAAIRERISGIDLARITPKREAKIRDIQAALEAEGRSLPSRLLGKLNDLSKIDIKDLSADELNALKADVEEFDRMGRDYTKTFKQAQDEEHQALLSKLAEDAYAKPINSLEKIIRDTKVGGIQAVKDKAWNMIASSQKALSVFEKASTNIPVLFQLLDGRAGGFLNKTVYGPVLLAHRIFRKEMDLFTKEAYEIAQKHNLDRNNFVKVAIHAQLEGGYPLEEITKFSQDPELPKIIKDYQENGLNAGEQEFYNYARSVFDDQIPELTRFSNDYLNKEVELYKNYWPRAVDTRKLDIGKRENQQIMEDLFDSLESPRKTTTIKSSVRYGRKEGASIPLNLNAMEVFLNHQKQWLYMKNLQPVLSKVNRVVQDSLFEEKYGQTGKQFLNDYIDVVARDGKYYKAGYEKALDAVRNIAMVGYIGLSKNQFKHVANYQLGMIEAGGANWWARGVIAAFTKEGKEFIEKYISELKERAGGDITIQEAAEGKFSKARRVLFAVDRSLDYINSVGISLGKYMREMHESGADWEEFHNTIPSGESLNSMHESVVKTVGSPAIVDQPLITSKGTGVGSKSVAKAIMAYSSPKLVKWGRIRTLLSKNEMGQREAGKASLVATALLASSLIEAGVVVGSGKILLAATHSLLNALGFRTFDRKYEENKLKAYLLDAMSDLVSAFPGGTIGKSFISAYRYPQQAEKIFTSTGIPPIDTATQFASRAYLALFNHDKKSIIALGETIAQTMLPVSTLLTMEREGAKLLDARAQQKRDILEIKKEREEKYGKKPKRK
jgi:hypothetical protein